jgi:hypothetical protein
VEHDSCNVTKKTCTYMYNYSEPIGVPILFKIPSRLSAFLLKTWNEKQSVVSRPSTALSLHTSTEWRNRADSEVAVLSDISCGSHRNRYTCPTSSCPSVGQTNKAKYLSSMHRILLSKLQSKCQNTRRRLKSSARMTIFGCLVTGV